MTLTVRPIEYHHVKPVSEELQNSYANTENTFSKKTRAALFRKRRFPVLKERDYPPVPNYLVAHITILTQDNCVLFFRRRKRGLGYSGGCWSASFEEGLNADWKRYLDPAEVFPPSSTPDMSIKDALQRALREELKLSDALIAGTELRVLALALEFETLNVALLATAKVPARADSILGNRQLKSGEEHDCFAYCPFEVASLAPVLREDGKPPTNLIVPEKEKFDLARPWKWHPTSRMRLYLNLAHELSVSTIDAILHQKFNSDANPSTRED